MQLVQMRMMGLVVVLSSFHIALCGVIWAEKYSPIETAKLRQYYLTSSIICSRINANLMQPMYYEKPNGFSNGTDTLNFPEPSGSSNTLRLVVRIEDILEWELISGIELVSGLNFGTAAGVVAGGARMELRTFMSSQITTLTSLHILSLTC